MTREQGSLIDFAVAQVKAVEATVRGINQLVDIDPNYNTYEASKRCIANNPLLRGVSPEELTIEAIAPGSFRKSMGL